MEKGGSNGCLLYLAPGLKEIKSGFVCSVRIQPLHRPWCPDDGCQVEITLLLTITFDRSPPQPASCLKTIRSWLASRKTLLLNLSRKLDSHMILLCCGMAQASSIVLAVQYCLGFQLAAAYCNIFGRIKNRDSTTRKYWRSVGRFKSVGPDTINTSIGSRENYCTCHVDVTTWFFLFTLLETPSEMGY